MENNMNEWKELQINKLPEDILTGGYEFRSERNNVYSKKDQKWFIVIEILFELCKNRVVLYRKPGPKQALGVTAEEAMQNMKKVMDSFFESCPKSPPESE
jgi:hypothetical protein